MLDDLRGRLAERNLTARADRRGARWLVTNGYDEAYGARPLRRLIRKSKTRLRDGSLARVARGGSLVKVDVADDRLAFAIEASPEVDMPSSVAEVSRQAA